jgi:hypothetical protein
LIFKKWDGGGMDGIHLAQDRDRWLALVNVAMNLRVPRNAENSLTSQEAVMLLKKASYPVKPVFIGVVSTSEPAVNTCLK